MDQSCPPQQRVAPNLFDLNTLRTTLNTIEDSILKSFPLSNLQSEHLEIIENKANELKLIYKLTPQAIKAVADESVLLEFSRWLYEFLDAVLLGDYASEKVSISAFHKPFEHVILSKAKELDLRYDFKHDLIKITGLRQARTEFKDYLRQVERLLFPEGTSKILNADSLKRIKKEFDEIQTDSSLENIFITLPEDNDLSRWTVDLLGPADTPYEAGIFKLEVRFPPEYPAVSPQLAFQTRVYHPCVDDSGGMCLGLLTHWTPVTSMRHVLLTVLAMLDNPEMEESVMEDIFAQYQQDRRGFEETAQAWTEKFANP